jgi:Glycosyl transferase family 8
MQAFEMVGSNSWRVTALKSRYRIAEVEAVNDICEKLNRVIEAIVSSENLFSAAAPRHAYLTFATPDYHWGLTIWLRSLRKVSDKPAFVLVSREMPLPADISDVYVIMVPELHNDDSKVLAASHRPEFRHVLNKLWIFAALAFDRIFYTDVDCLFLKSPDELFTRSGFLVCPDYVNTRGADGFNSGVMVFDPNRDLRERIFAEVLCGSSEDGGDQGYLNVILRDEVVFVDEKYNILRHFHDISQNSASNDARILHYIVKKPWEIHFREGADAVLIRLDDLWTSFLELNELQDLVAEWRRSTSRNWEVQRLRELNVKIRGVKRSVWAAMAIVAAVEVVLAVLLLQR